MFIYATGAEMAQGGVYAGFEKNLQDTMTSRCMAAAGFQEPLGSGDASWFDNARFPDIERRRRTWQIMPGGPNPPEAEAKDFSGFMGFADGQLMRAPSDSDRAVIDTRLAKVFVTCASSTVALQETLQVAAEKEFLQEHYQQITALEAATDAVVAKTRAQLGIATG